MGHARVLKTGSGAAIGVPLSSMCARQGHKYRQSFDAVELAKLYRHQLGI